MQPGELHVLIEGQACNDNSLRISTEQHQMMGSRPKRYPAHQVRESLSEEFIFNLNPDISASVGQTQKQQPVLKG